MSDRRESHWLSPELELEFRSMNQAIEFDNISKDCSDEEEAWDKYLTKLKLRGGRLHVLHVVGGNGALPSALSKRETLISRGWEEKPCDTNNPRLSHWFSPELELEFQSTSEAMKFSNIQTTEQCGCEKEAWKKYWERLSAEGGKVYVVGGNLALRNALYKKNIDHGSDSLNIEGDFTIADNDDECFICGDGGGKNSVKITHVSLL